MRSTRWFSRCLTGLVGAYALWVSSAAQGQLFLDDFEDGSIVDGVPATWKRYAPPFDLGEIEVLDGSLVLTPPTSGTPSVPNVGLYWETDVYLADYLYHDVNVKAQFRGLANGTSVAGVTVLDTEATEGPSGVFVGGHVYHEGATRWMRINYSGARGSGPLATKTLPFSHLSDEVSLRMVVTGLNVTLTAWPADQPEPAPQIVTRLPPEFSGKLGHIAAFAGNRTTSVPIAFRYIEVSAVPEPTTSILCGIACVALAARRRRGTPWRGGSATIAALAAAIWAVGSAGQAATIFYDDFEDGSATDGSPVTWEPRVFTNGSLQVDDGSYTLTPGVVGEALVSVVDGLTPADVSIRSQVRTSGNVDGIGLFARFQEGAFTYQGGIDSAGDVYIGWNGPDTRYTNLGNVLTALRPTLYDVSLQFDVFGDDLRMYAWRSGEAMPTQPTVHVLSSLRRDPGQVGVLNDPRSSAVVAFRYVHVADAPIPEPSTLGLFGLAAAGGVGRSSRRRLASVR